MEELGIKCQQIENGIEDRPDGTKLRLPPVLFGQLGNDKSKKTLLVYGHLDVQPADVKDGWVCLFYAPYIIFRTQNLLN